MTETKPNWSNKKTLIKQLQRLWERGVLLRESIQPEGLFPLRLVFKSPGSKALTEEFVSIRSWLSEIEKLNGYRIKYKTVHHRLVGENRLPDQVWVDDLETAVALLNKQQEISAFSKLQQITWERAPELLDWLIQSPLKALSLAEEWSKLLDFVLWRREHANGEVYLRQVSLPGIDSKFIEQHRSILAPLLDRILPQEQINQEYSGVKYFEKRYGFRSKPERIRFRLPLMEPAILPGIDCDITLTADDFCRLNRQAQFSAQIKRVFITENEINFLSFPLPKDSLVIFGAGYGFDALAKADWLSQLKIYYWGDIDTHGFAILDQFRSKFPDVKSLLMDEETLLKHRDFWGRESKPENKPLSQLINQEQLIYQNLLHNHYAENLRLEQERINFDCLAAVLDSLDKFGNQ